MVPEIHFLKEKRLENFSHLFLLGTKSFRPFSAFSGVFRCTPPAGNTWLAITKVLDSGNIQTLFNETLFEIV